MPKIPGLYTHDAEEHDAKQKEKEKKWADTYEQSEHGKATIKAASKKYSQQPHVKAKAKYKRDNRTQEKIEADRVYDREQYKKSKERRKVADIVLTPPWEA